MRCLVIGYGSIGKRHANVLTRLGHQVHLLSRRDDTPHPVTSDLDDALNRFAPLDLAIIATATADHGVCLQRLLERGFRKTVLVEKPLFLSASDHLPDETLTDRIFVGYNLRFHPMLQRLRVLLQGKTLYAATISVGQHLSQWRPGTDHRQSYSSHRSRGGGVLRDLSHEIDTCAWLLGRCTSLSALGGRFSSLTVDSDDSFSLLAVHERCPCVSLHMNCLDQTARREIVIQHQDGTVHADLIAGTLETGNGTETFRIERDTTYTHQLQNLIAGKTDDACSYQQGLAVVRVIEAAEKAAKEKKWITL